MKKISAALLVLVLALTLIVPAFADGAPTMTVSSADAKLGEEVSVTVSLANNPGIVGMTLRRFEYDSAKLQLLSITESGMSGTWQKATGVTWASDIGDNAYNGVFLTLKFKVLDNAKTGSTPVSVYYEEGDICNNALDDVNFTVVPGAVNITCEHAWDAGTVTTQPSCTVEGVKTFTCSKCGGTRTEPVAKTAHQTELRNAVTPSCTAPGYSGDQVCTVCGNTITPGHTLEMVAHSYDAGTVTTPATCTAEGVKTFTCSVCGDTKTEPVAKTAHQIEVRGAVASTCTTHGFSGDEYCTSCNNLIKAGRELPFAPHVWTSTGVKTAATCTDAGVEGFACENCTATKEEPIAAKGHAWDEGKVIKEATCTDDGVMGFACKNCTAAKEEPITAKGHTWDEGKVIKEAECTVTGEKEFTCTVCGETKIEEIPKLPVDVNPDTGDESRPILWASLLGVSAILSVSIVVIIKKKRT